MVLVSSLNQLQSLCQSAPPITTRESPIRCHDGGSGCRIRRVLPLWQIQSRMTHVLCIGMSGTLAGCVRSLIMDGHRIACLARNPSRLKSLKDSIPDETRPSLSTHLCDYRDLSQLAQTLDAMPFEPEAAICWVHSPADPVLRVIRERFPGSDMLRVLGSSTQKPDDRSNDLGRFVTLGFVIEHGRSRWLTHEEISAGVYEAFVSGKPESIVGVIEPWEMRP